MKYGFAIPNGGPMANGEGIAALAGKGEALGFGTQVLNKLDGTFTTEDEVQLKAFTTEIANELANEL